MKFFDTHAHLADPEISSRLSDVLATASKSGVACVAAIGTDLSSSLQCLEMAREHPGVYAAVGIHPNSCHLAADEQWPAIKRLATEPRVVAIGETGLDCHWDDCPLSVQQTWFARHIELSQETGKPLVIHQRDSEQPILEALMVNHQSGNIHGIMHSFTGSLDTAQACLKLGMYISFAGMVTFKNAQSIRDVAKCVPADRLLIETDSPYLTPHPFRGQRPNEPKMLVHTAAFLSEWLGYGLNDFAELTTANANRVFGIGQPN